MTARAGDQRSSFWRLGRRVVLVTIIAVAALELLYVIAGNALLWTGQIERWGTSGSFFLKLGFSWTPWPARVYVRDLLIRHEDYNIQMEIEIPRARVDLDLLPLVKRTFHARRVWAEGTQFRFRHKVHDIRGNERRVAAFAHIDGFADPPLYVGPEQPPLDDAHYNLWTIHLENVDADVRELWLLEYRYRGTARATGAFRLVPQRGFRLEPSTLQLDPGTLSVGSEEVSPRLYGDIRCTVDQHDPRQVPDLQVFRRISTRVRLSAEVADLTVANTYLKPGGPTIGEGEGKVSANADVDHGQVSSTTRIEFATPRVKVHAGPFALLGPVVSSFSVVNTRDGGQQGKVVLTSPDIEAAARSVTIGSATESRLELWTETVDLSRPLSVRTWAAKVGRALVPELRHLNGVVAPRDRPFQGGAIGAALNLHADDDGSTGVARVDVHAASVRVPNIAVTASGSIDARWRSKRQNPTSGAIEDLRIRVDRATLEPKSGPPVEWWLVARSGRLRWNGLPPKRFEGRFELEGPSVKPLLRTLTGGNFAAAASTVFTRFDDTHATIAVDRRKNGLTVQLEHVRSGDFAARGLWQKNGSEECSAFLVSLKIGQVGVLRRDGKDSFYPFATQAWLERHMARPCGDA